MSNGKDNFMSDQEVKHEQGLRNETIKIAHGALAGRDGGFTVDEMLEEADKIYTYLNKPKVKGRIMNLAGETK